MKSFKQFDHNDKWVRTIQYERGAAIIAQILKTVELYLNNICKIVIINIFNDHISLVVML